MKFLHRIQQGVVAVCLGVLLGGSFSESREKATLVHNGTYRVNQLATGGVWKGGTASLTAADLREHLINLNQQRHAIVCFKELGRLILAQGLYVDNRITYDHDNLDNSEPNYINRQRAGDLCETPTLSDLVDHLFDHGHLGWYPYAGLIGNSGANTVVQVDPHVAPRGIFNIDPTIRDRIFFGIRGWAQNLLDSLTRIDGGSIILRGTGPAGPGRIQGYDVDSPPDEVINLEGAALNLITCLFSSDAFESVNFGRIEYVRNSQTNARFNIYATYNGGPIQGIDYTHPTVSPPPDNCLGLQSNGTPTNRICLVVGVYNGTIYIASLYPEG